ncbi:hypothetical protein [Kitasatospora camelliae]|uniref:Secreted protein n=1 Tax=Kitasatospora camelliae TaxID=3156397 RepID=A0AAU8K4T3_9ACTN
MNHPPTTTTTTTPASHPLRTLLAFLLLLVLLFAVSFTAGHLLGPLRPASGNDDPRPAPHTHALPTLLVTPESVR